MERAGGASEDEQADKEGEWMTGIAEQENNESESHGGEGWDGLLEVTL
jgi:hypothetical protein